jgi:predicted nucleic acid binding AN1-type Zn finger protein
MATCDHCGQADASFSCSYCGRSVCADHRLPESHDCPGLETAESHGPDFREVDHERITNRSSDECIDCGAPVKENRLRCQQCHVEQRRKEERTRSDRDASTSSSAGATSTTERTTREPQAKPGQERAREQEQDLDGPSCAVCGDRTVVGGLAYRCTYCGEPVCRDHRLPENHGCTAELLPPGQSAGDVRVGERPVVSYDPDETSARAAIANWGREHGVEVEPMDLSGQSLPGETPERKRGKTGSSPDVAPDGSIVQEEIGGSGDADEGRKSEGLLASLRLDRVAWWIQVLVLLAVIGAVVVAPLVVTGVVSV